MDRYQQERIDWEKIKKGIDSMFPQHRRKRDTTISEKQPKRRRQRRNNPYPLNDTATKKRVMERLRKRAEKLHTAGRREWAILHTTQRHKCEVSEVVIITVNVPRSKLRRRWRGLWTTAETLQTFADFTDATEFAETPIA